VSLLVMTCLVKCSAPDHEDGYVLEAMDNKEAVTGQVHSIIINLFFSDISHHGFGSHFLLRGWVNEF
jgi:hypothetical protein